MNIKSLFRSIAKTSMAVAIGISAFATTSQAATFTVNGSDWDITTFTGSLLDNQTLFEAQVWWGNEVLATEFATVVGSALGLFNFPNVGGNTGGPLFAYTEYDQIEGWFVGGFYSSAHNGFVTRGAVDGSGAGTTFAVATPVSAVPLPAGGLLLLSGLAGAAALKRRKKRTA